MEFALNLVWFGVAISMFGLWFGWAPVGEGNRRVQCIALLLLIAILLPAISLTDDLLAAQNPAEINTSMRRDIDSLTVHADIPVAIVPAIPIISEVSVRMRKRQGPGALWLPVPIPPALTSIDNRPPPTA
jgi:hypothetical protein